MKIATKAKNTNSNERLYDVCQTITASTINKAAKTK